MKTTTVMLLVGTTLLLGNPVLAEEHGKEATQHLDQAVKSGKKGDATGAAAHTEEAQKHLIEQNAEQPYTQPAKQITGENPKAAHDAATFDQMRKATGHAKKGHGREAAAAAGKAATHLQEKEQSK
jgi:hypothetical protein